MANVFTNPTYRTPLVGDGRGDFACPPDHLTLDEVVTAFEEAGLDPEVSGECVEAAGLSVFWDAGDPANPGWAYRLRHRFSQESGTIDTLAQVFEVADLAAANL